MTPLEEHIVRTVEHAVTQALTTTSLPVARLLVSVADAADMLDVSRTSIDTLIEAGELDVVVVGRGRKITVSSIHACVDRNVRTGLRAVS